MSKAKGLHNRAGLLAGLQKLGQLSWESWQVEIQSLWGTRDSLDFAVLFVQKDLVL